MLFPLVKLYFLKSITKLSLLEINTYILDNDGAEVSSHHSSMVSMAACFWRSPGFKSWQGFIWESGDIYRKLVTYIVGSSSLGRIIGKHSKYAPFDDQTQFLNLTANV